jgi:predicted  nucleic acid-binding Zn-ribbon protein
MNTSVKLVIVALVSFASAAEQREQVAANPIRKVVMMLQNLAKTVASEGEKETELFEKFMCYCKNGASTLDKSIGDAETKIPQVQADIEAGENAAKQLKADIKSAQTDRAAAKAAMAEATSIREKEAATYADYKAESDANIAAATGAYKAIEKGMAGSFLQSGAAQVLKKLVLSDTNAITDYEREEITSFLSNPFSQGYAAQSGQIVGMLKQMAERMTKDLDAATDAENKSIKEYEGLMAAKTKEVNACTEEIEDKMVRLGNLQVEIVEMKEDLDDTAKALAEDKKFLADLDKNCATKQQEHEENMKLRAQELVALADTIKLLNSDDALELFKKTLPSASASFVQLQVTKSDLQRRALAAIRAGQRKGHPELSFIALALQGKKVNFSKVIKMIDAMVVNLKAEQEDDNDKQEYCEKSFDTADDKKKSLERSVSNLEKAIGKDNEAIDALTVEIKALQESIVALDKSVSEATEVRKEENADYTELMANDAAAKELIGLARNRMNKFYNPKLYKAPPKRVLSEEDRIVVNMGGTLAPTAAPGGISGTGITAPAVAVLADVSVHKAAPPPPPATAEAYTKASEESNGVIAMMDVLIKDLTKEMTEAETAEKEGQADYEAAMKDAAEKRADDSQSLADKQKAKSQTEADLESNTEEKAATTKTLMATEKHIMALHGECDWLLKYYEVRKEARAGEVESLENAKAVLSGADYSLLATGRTLHRLRGA